LPFRLYSADLAFVGDINFTGFVGEKIAEHGYKWPFYYVREELRSADYTVGNLESPAGVGGAKFCDKKVYFKANPDTLDALLDAGFDMVSLANNHALDYGPDILRQTMEGLDRRGIKYIGLRNDSKSPYVPTIVHVKGLKLAFLGYCNACMTEFGPTPDHMGVNAGMSQTIKAQVRRLRREQKPDFIIALVHWGKEYHGVDANQRYTQKAFLDAGVDVIIGSHPHVLQLIEQDKHRFGNPLTAFSLGNFLFPMRWQISLSSVILHVSLTVDKFNEKHIKYEYTFIDLHDKRPSQTFPNGIKDIARMDYVLQKGYEYGGVRTWPVNELLQ